MNFFKKEQPVKQPVQKPNKKRSFEGANNYRFVQWLNTSYSKINLDLDNGLITLLSRTRELAKNSTVVRSYLELMEKNIIGRSGFTLQSQVKKSDGSLNNELNDFLEWEYYDWQKAANGFLTIDGQLGGKELDKLILRTLLIDGEVFVRVRKSASNPYGVSFELIDAMSIDFTKRREASPNQNAIVLGVEIDKNYKPVAYYFRPRNYGSLSGRFSGEDTCISDDTSVP